MNEVYVTGMGLIASSGYGGSNFISGLSGKSQNFCDWPQDQHPPSVNARVGLANDYPVPKYFNERQLRLADRAMVMAMCAVGTALEDAGIEQLDCIDEVATIFGSMRSEHSSTQKFSVPLLTGRPKSLNAAQFPMIARNVACGQVAMNLGLRGMSSMICSGSLASLQAIARGYDLVRRGRVPVAIVGGVETLSKFSINHSRHLYRDYLHGEAPQFFGRGNGLLIPAEGCSMLILESGKHAAERQAKPYARITGAFSGRLGRDEDGGTAAGLMTHFLSAGGDAAKAWRDVGFISASNAGSQTVASLTEMDMLGTIYERYGISPPVTAARSWIGEAESVASALQVQVAASALHAGVVPPTVSISANHAIGLNIVDRSHSFSGDAVVTGFDESQNYAFLRLASPASTGG